MERLRTTLDHLRRQHRCAIIPFIMGGDPDLETTGALLLALQDAGADLLEVGIPFSDPLADGPTIQAASARALHRGATPAGVLEAIGAVRRRLSVPIVCLSYWNPVLQFGLEAFARRAAQRGVSGLIVPDLPVEEGEPLRQAARRAGIAAIFLAAPTSPPERLRAIARASQGFIYYVSVTGTTGARRRLPQALLHGVRQVKRLTTTPVCVGFGISTPAQAARVARVADGVIVGSALIRAMEGARGRSKTLARAARVLRWLRSGLRS